MGVREPQASGKFDCNTIGKFYLTSYLEVGTLERTAHAKAAGSVLFKVGYIARCISGAGILCPSPTSAEQLNRSVENLGKLLVLSLHCFSFISDSLTSEMWT